MNASVSLAYVKMPGSTLRKTNADEVHTEMLFQLYQVSRGGHSTLTEVREQANSPELRKRIAMGAAPAEASLAMTVIQMHMCVGPGRAWADMYATDHLCT